LVSGKAEAAFAIEDGIRFPIDPLKGQKTGFFFDQRDNRSFFRDWVAGASQSRSIHALDLFCHAGAWGLRALKAGAKKATFVDSSKSALESVQAAAKLMGVADRVELLEGDAQEILKSLKPESFQAISLDPPALIPNKKSIPQGSKHYFDLHLDALRVAAPGGLFSSSSCSHHLLEDRFEEIVRRALLESGKNGSVLRRGGLSADHPFLAGMEEGRYLKNLSVAI
jgi:23S rRNA (cytosine1962-C5)-methyltransferase